MSKPMVHARSSAKLFGGKPKDYLDIHQLLDSSREGFPDLRHRALTHHSWFITKIIPLVFGEARINSDGKPYSTRSVAEHHVLEDFHGKYIPSAQDYLLELEFKEWMDNGKGDEPPASHKKLGKYIEAMPKKRKISPHMKQIVKTTLQALGGKPTGRQISTASLLPHLDDDDFSRRPCASGPPGTFD